MTYSKNERAAKALEQKTSARALDERWVWLNVLRAAIMAFGCVLGAYGLAVQRQ